MSTSTQSAPAFCPSSSFSHSSIPFSLYSSSTTTSSPWDSSSSSSYTSSSADEEEKEKGEDKMEKGNAKSFLVSRRALFDIEMSSSSWKRMSKSDARYDLHRKLISKSSAEEEEMEENSAEIAIGESFEELNNHHRTAASSGGEKTDQRIMVKHRRHFAAGTAAAGGHRGRRMSFPTAGAATTSSLSSNSQQQNWGQTAGTRAGKHHPHHHHSRRRRDSSSPVAISSASAAFSSAEATTVEAGGGSGGPSRRSTFQSILTMTAAMTITGDDDHEGGGEQQQEGRHRQKSAEEQKPTIRLVPYGVGTTSNADGADIPTPNFPRQNRRLLSQSQEELGPSSNIRNAENMASTLTPARLDGLVYLGCSKMQEPTSEAEMLDIMATLNAEKGHQAVPVSLLLAPGQQTNGIVRLLEAPSSPFQVAAEICSFPINRIRFCARGKLNSPEGGCFALSFTQVGKMAARGNNNTGTASTLHQCHVFRCLVPEQAAQALFCFAQAFRAVQQQRQQQYQQQQQQTGQFRHKNSLGNEKPPEFDQQTSPSTHQQPPQQQQKQELFEFEALLEIRERDSGNHRSSSHFKNAAAVPGTAMPAATTTAAAAAEDQHGFAVCPLEKSCFKMRRDREKRVVIMLKQTAGPRHLRVRNCFGLLLAPGRNLRQSDMHLLEMQSAAEGQQNANVFVVEARWDPSALNFEVLNTETPRDSRVFMTIAVDVIFEGLDESIRFNLECKARIFQQFERFWSPQRRAMSETYTLLVQHQMDERASTSSADSGICYADPPPTTDNNSSKDRSATLRKVLHFESATERERQLTAQTIAGGKEKSPSRQMPTQLIHPADDDESDCDEPLLSGSGEVSRECSEDKLTAWREVIEQWKANPDQRPPGLNSLIHDGVPDVMRGEVWLLLARVGTDQNDLIQTYQMLLEKECPSDAVILRDIHRTFPAHEYFKEENGEQCGQKALYRISKAYSLYDEEVGYCQGLSFLAAALLLHMPEERAFCVLVRIMFDYGMRELFKTGFDALHLRFYQLQRLVKDYAHELYAHFYEIGVETHMYASQWFLTLFTAKFPLQMVFFIVDLFLAEGMNTIFHISLALLQDSKKELLGSDFEGILKFFRVNLPRKYRTENNAKELIHAAVKLKISHKRLAKYEKEWHELKRREIESQDPLERLERENCRLKEQILRLERENDDLAHELVTSKIGLQSRLDTTEDQLETTLNQVVRKSRECEEFAERERQLRSELEQLKQKCRLEVSRLEEEQRRADGVIAEYKRICTDLGVAADEDKRQFKEQKRIVAARISGCDRCATELSDWIGVESPQRPRSAMSNGSSGNKEENGANNDLANGCTPALHMMELVERIQQREEHIRQVELELAQTKLALVESQCQNQDLAHQMSTSTNQQSHLSNGDSDNRPAWLKKTISSLMREVAAHQTSAAGSSNNEATTTNNHLQLRVDRS